MRHGYTNSTTRTSDGVLKCYAGPDSAARAEAEFAALSRLSEVMPVPAVVRREPSGFLVTEFRAGRHGQELIDEGHAEPVLAACGVLLRRLHALDPSLLAPGDHPTRHVITHGDFGPNNVLIDPGSFSVAALLDWEFCSIGPAVNDLAWCEWIVRMHHPSEAAALPALFLAYGARPSWTERHQAMVQRCRWLGAFAQRWDPGGESETAWSERACLTASWEEQPPS